MNFLEVNFRIYCENFIVIFCFSPYLKIDFMDTQVPPPQKKKTNKKLKTFIVRVETFYRLCFLLFSTQ